MKLPWKPLFQKKELNYVCSFYGFGYFSIYVIVVVEFQVIWAVNSNRTITMQERREHVNVLVMKLGHIRKIET